MPHRIGNATILACLLGLLLAVACPAIRAQTEIIYELRYSAPGDRVSMKISPRALIAAPATLVIPRTYPGGYSQVSYDSFMENVTAVSQDGKTLTCTKEADGPRWKIGQKGEMQLAIPAESGVTPWAIHREAEKLGVQVFEFRQHFIVEGHLIATDWAPVGGIKRQHDGTPAEVAQTD